MAACAVDGCVERASTRGWCVMHYTRWKRHGDVEATARDRRPAIDKVWEKVEVDEATGCNVWTGYRSKAGYGYIADRGRVVLVHRLVWENQVGPIPEGLELDHLCFTTNCLSVAHLEPVSPAENKRRMVVHQQEAKTHCPQGHPYEGDNLRREKDGHRRCRTCREAQMVTRNQQRRAS